MLLPLDAPAAAAEPVTFAKATDLPLFVAFEFVLVVLVPMVLVVLVPDVVVSPVEDSKSEELGVDPEEHKETDKSESSDSVRF